MSILVPLTLLGWIPLVTALFLVLPPRRAVIVAFGVAWLFLPMASYELAGLPDYTKMSATCLGVLLGATLFDSGRLTGFRPRLMDVPMGIWCLVPLASSMSNNLGLYDGASAVVHQVVTWGLPYLIGRIYFDDREAVRELAIGIFIGGLIYIPLCLYEIRMSPQLHTIVYGFHQHSFEQTWRQGGWRPTVFMQHGLMVGMWMSMTTLVGFWLWRSQSLVQLWGVPTLMLVLGLGATAIACKSFGALVLGTAGLAVLLMGPVFKSRLLLVGLLAAAPAYMMARVAGDWSGQPLVELAQTLGGEQRAGSMQFRMNHEDLLMDKAMERPWLGWGGWARAWIRDEAGRGMSVTDGLWIIALGNHGIVGLAALAGALLLPAALVLHRWRVEAWQDPSIAPIVVVSVLCALYLADCVPNGMVNPIFTLAAGAVLAAIGKDKTDEVDEYEPSTVTPGLAIGAIS